MFKRIRQLQISLAAKCQLLFGAAVVLIIAAGLFVPWQRMEQLVQQLDERAAETLAQHALAEHMADPYRRPASSSVETDAAEGPGETGDEPSEAIVDEAPETIDLELHSDIRPADAYPLGHRVRLIAASPPHADRITRFERRALDEFAADRSLSRISRSYERPDGTRGYRYVRALYATNNCLACHSDNASQPHELARMQLLEDNLPSLPLDALLGIVSIDIPSQIEPAQLLLNRLVILIAGLLAGTLAIAVFYLITTRLILHPVRVLQETAEKVSQGDLNIRSDISTGDEFQQLSETFNIMLANLKQTQDQLRAVNKSLDLKLGQLAETNLALYESNRLKSEFLANVSHELRTPLNSILGFAELLKDSGPIADPKTARYVQNIVRSGQNLLDLINDLLDLAKIEAGRMEVRSEPLSVPDLFEGLTSILKPIAEPKALRIDTVVQPDVPIIHTDPAKLQQVLYNFLSNAIKFSPSGQRVELRADRVTDDSVRISVTDHGPGIEPEKQEEIFEKFRQLDSSATREHSGTGLGLAISKELVNLLGGSIGVRSRPLEGACFWVVLPLRIDAAERTLRAAAM